MSTNQALRDMHLAAEASRWDSAVLGVGRLLNSPEVQVRSLTRRLLTLDSQTRFYVFGAGTPALHGFQFGGGSVVQYLENVAHLICYEICDDGEPAVAYMRHDLMDGFVACGADHPEAKPYLHRNLDLLRTDNPEAKSLTCGTALEVLDRYVADRAKILKNIQELLELQDGWFTFEDVASYDPTPEELLYRGLVEELTDPRYRADVGPFI